MAPRGTAAAFTKLPILSTRVVLLFELCFIEALTYRQGVDNEVQGVMQPLPSVFHGYPLSVQLNDHFTNLTGSAPFWHVVTAALLTRRQPTHPGFTGSADDRLRLFLTGKAKKLAASHFETPPTGFVWSPFLSHSLNEAIGMGVQSINTSSQR